jgi:hypothetical protein
VGPVIDAGKRVEVKVDHELVTGCGWPPI